ncbi:hypothetical protein JW960_17580 [candidate division KSB1 bacterium]|nr:hypothetical protein [candidate division KSB1 bacterium]
MARKFHKDITRDRQIYELATDIHSPELGDYYFLMTEAQMLAGHSQQYHFDEQGIPIIPTYIDVSEQRMLYYPISIGQYGLAIWNTYLKTKQEHDRNRFLKIADWFMANAISDDKLGAYWLTDVDKPAYNIKRPWKSSFSQARAINVLMRAYQITQKNNYKTMAELAIEPFFIPVVDGGVTTFTENGPFFEEYPASVPVLVLNGHIFSICGVYDYIRTHPDDQRVRSLYNDSVQSLSCLIDRFDMGFWSKYSLCEANFHPSVDPSTIGYHCLHIVQLDLMYALTNQAIFKGTADRWQKYLKTTNILKMYFIKYRALKKMNRI